MPSAAVPGCPAGAVGTLRKAARLALTTLLALGVGLPFAAGTAIAAASDVTVRLTADEGQDPYAIGARVDVRVRIDCSGASACGPVEVVIGFDQWLAFESSSVVHDRLTDPGHYPDVVAVVSPDRPSFTIGTTEPIAPGRSVTIPISARGKGIPDHGPVSIDATASTAKTTSRASLRLLLAAGTVPTPALSNLILGSAPSSIGAARGTTANLKLLVANTGDAPVAAGWRVTVLVPRGVRLLSLSGSGLRCSAATCTADSGLAPGATAAPVLAVVRVDGRVAAKARLVAYVRPAGGDVAESSALGKTPLVTTNSRTTATDNDTMVVFSRDRDSDRLPYTGGREVRGILALGLLLVAVGGGLLAPRWRRAAN